MRLDQLAAELLYEGFGVEGMDLEVNWPRDPHYEGPCNLIDVEKVEQLTDLLMRFVAEVVVAVVDAGSERDAVNENEDLRRELLKELYGWTRGTVTPEEMKAGMVMDWEHNMVVPAIEPGRGKDLLP